MGRISGVGACFRHLLQESIAGQQQTAHVAVQHHLLGDPTQWPQGRLKVKMIYHQDI
jgi:hypothetical protein